MPLIDLCIDAIGSHGNIMCILSACPACVGQNPMGLLLHEKFDSIIEKNDYEIKNFDCICNAGSPWYFCPSLSYVKNKSIMLTEAANLMRPNVRY